MGEDAVTDAQEEPQREDPVSLGPSNLVLKLRYQAILGKSEVVVHPCDLHRLSPPLFWGNKLETRLGQRGPPEWRVEGGRRER
jgi:hypothetical protein